MILDLPTTAECSDMQKIMDDHFLQVKLDNMQVNNTPSKIP